jgi:hypothetical protein
MKVVDGIHRAKPSPFRAFADTHSRFLFLTSNTFCTTCDMYKNHRNKKTTPLNQVCDICFHLETRSRDIVRVLNFMSGGYGWEGSTSSAEWLHDDVYRKSSERSRWSREVFRVVFENSY